MTKQSKRWIKFKDRSLPKYLNRIDGFLEFSFFLWTSCQKQLGLHVVDVITLILRQEMV